MKQYVDGFVLVVPKKNLKAYQRMAETAGKIWKKHGALQYVECVGEDMKAMKGVLPFPKLTKQKPGEVVVFSWIVYKSKAHRNAVNAKVMKDPKMNEACDGVNIPFDMKRMAYGGFTTLVNL